jgi:uncharacterized protein YutE (UPF0331/DUF86 family)
VQAVVSPERLEEKFRRLGEFLAVLRELRSIPAEALPGDLVRMGSVKYYLQVSIESCIDVAQHVIASEGFRPPKDYADTFTVLAERGILEQEFAERLRRMAKFRNRLVHLYGEVDDQHVVRVLAEDLGDFDLFRERILAMLK